MLTRTPFFVMSLFLAGFSFVSLSATARAHDEPDGTPTASSPSEQVPPAAGPEGGRETPQDATPEAGDTSAEAGFRPAPAQGELTPSSTNAGEGEEYPEVRLRQVDYFGGLQFFEGGLTALKLQLNGAWVLEPHGDQHVGYAITPNVGVGYGAHRVEIDAGPATMKSKLSMFFVELVPTFQLLYGVSRLWTIYGAVGFGAVWAHSNYKNEVPNLDDTSVNSSDLFGEFRFAAGAHYRLSRTTWLAFEPLGFHAYVGREGNGGTAFSVLFGLRQELL